MKTVNQHSLYPLLSQVMAGLILSCAALMLIAVLIGRGIPQRLIAYTVVEDDNHRSLNLMDINRELGHSASQQNVECCLAWSHDGQRLAFTARTEAGLRLYILNVLTHEQYPLSDGRTDNLAASWSPDNRNLAYVSLADGEYAVYTMSLTTGDARPISHLPIGNSNPVWSPDGSYLVFLAYFGFRNFQLFRVDADGNNPFLLSAATNIGSPSFSPDGSQVIYSGANGGGQRLFTVDVTTANRRQLTEQETDNSLYPSWSPDGTQILFSSSWNINNELYVMDADGENMRQLTRNQRNDLWPAWSPDGKQILFVSKRGTEEIHVINADGTNERRLASGTVNAAVWQP